MRWKAVFAASLPALLLHAGFAQQNFTDPVLLLQAVAKSYTQGTDTFHMESIVESTSNSELHHDWQKVYRSVIKDAGNRYRIETRSGYGSWVEDSDGTNEWLYLVEANKYLKRPLPERWPQFPSGTTGGYELYEAWAMRTWLEGYASSYKHAAMLPQETILVEGRSFSCYVVHVTNEDLTTDRDKDRKFDTAYWIDKQALVFRKQVEHQDSYIRVSDTIRIPMHRDVTTLYPVADFNPVIAPQMFVFSPPVGATEVAGLEWNSHQPAPDAAPQMAGKTIPDLTFVAEDGKQVNINAYRGKPLIIDLWATWCGPCLLSMPGLNRIFLEFKDRGLAVVTVDQDHAAQSATDYLALHQFAWTNYHDTKKHISKVLGNTLIPLTVLIDADGKIVYYDTGGDEGGLRKALATLGPDFSTPAPKPARR